MASSFDLIATEETLDLKSVPVVIEVADGKQYKFTVTELTPTELAKCFDEFQEIDHLAVVYRSVRDQDGFRMTKQQAAKLPVEIVGKFVNAYASLSVDKKK